MTLKEIKQTINSTEYSFLRENEHLGNNIILLGLGGSHAYGTNNKDSDLDIRNGKYLDNNKQPTSEFYDLLNDYEKRFEYAKQHTSLPDNPDYKAINEFVASVNERVVKDEI